MVFISNLASTIHEYITGLHFHYPFPSKDKVTNQYVPNLQANEKTLNTPAGQLKSQAMKLSFNQD